jgi:hypothetical protein
MYWPVILKVLPYIAALFIGWQVNDWRNASKEAAQMAAQVKKDKEAQQAVDKVRQEKNREIEAINTRLSAALVELRNRPTRQELSGNGQAGTGASLSAEDAGFLIGEAARADKIRSALSACYLQYEKVTK